MTDSIIQMMPSHFWCICSNLTFSVQLDVLYIRPPYTFLNYTTWTKILNQKKKKKSFRVNKRMTLYLAYWICQVYSCAIYLVWWRRWTCRKTRSVSSCSLHHTPCPPWAEGPWPAGLWTIRKPAKYPWRHGDSWPAGAACSHRRQNLEMESHGQKLLSYAHEDCSSCNPQ